MMQIGVFYIIASGHKAWFLGQIAGNTRTPVLEEDIRIYEHVMPLIP